MGEYQSEPTWRSDNAPEHRVARAYIKCRCRVKRSAVETDYVSRAGLLNSCVSRETQGERSCLQNGCIGRCGEIDVVL